MGAGTCRAGPVPPGSGRGAALVGGLDVELVAPLGAFFVVRTEGRLLAGVLAAAGLEVFSGLASLIPPELFVADVGDTGCK